MRYLPIILVFIVTLMFLGCGGKTTVKEEFIDTTPREDKSKTVSEKKDTPAEEKKSEEQTQDDQESARDKTEKDSGENGSTSPRPAPGQDDSGNGGMLPVPDRPSGAGNTADREKYMEDLMYPNSQPVQGPSLPPSNVHSGRTIVSSDSPETVTAWYMNKFGDKATPSTSPYGTVINVDDPGKGYQSTITVQKAGNQGQTLIVISVKNKE